MHREGRGGRQVQLTHLLGHITRDELDGRLHFGNDALRFVNAIQATLSETFVLRHAANRVNLIMKIGGNELRISTHAALEIDKVVGLAEATDALGHLLALGAEALDLLARRLGVVLSLLRRGGVLRGPNWPLRFPLVVRLGSLSCHLFESRLSFRAALLVARCLVAKGPEAALTSSCCTWNKSGE